MPFKKKGTAGATADSPEAMYHDVRPRNIQGLLSHQADIAREYYSSFLSKKDVAIQLPTGSGKTLVGLVIAEWQRRKNGRRVVYLCPTKQLVHQVVDQAVTKYGLKPTAFVGKQKEYSAIIRSAYNSNETIAVTTYNGYFNTNSFFSDAEIALFDDAHAAENYVAKYWSLEISRYDDKTFYDAILSVFQDALDSADYLRLSGDRKRQAGDGQWVEKLPSEYLASFASEVIALFDQHAKGDRHRFAWSVLRDHLSACQFYLAFDSILLRPLICPTETYTPFGSLKQRVYMSATLGAAGDLERLWGVSDIGRIPVPVGWDKQGIGRRFFMFPEVEMSDKDASNIAATLIKKVPRAVVLPPDSRTEDAIGEDLSKKTGYKIIDAETIERSKSAFISATDVIAIMAGRYDGIDFNADECRLLILSGLPRALNLQERFLTWRMGAGAMLRDRVLTRVVQGAGRCTRSATDYACVVVLGQDLTKFFLQPENRRLFHPELQAEIEFGIDQSKGASAPDYAEYLDHFIAQDAEWTDVEKDIFRLREQKTQDSLPAALLLKDAVPHEVRYQYAMWYGNYGEALTQCRAVLGKLTGNDVKGYRAFWYYLAASAAFWAGSEGNAGMDAVARDNYRRSIAAVPALKWLVKLCRAPIAETITDVRDPLLALQIEGLEHRLEQLGNVNDRRFEAEVKLILDGLSKSDAKPFETAHQHLGRLLGFTSDRSDEEAAPDAWWCLGNQFCLVFEDHTNVKDVGHSIGANKVRQASSHTNWVLSHLGFQDRTVIKPVLVSPCTSLAQGATPHTDDLAYWNAQKMADWAMDAINIVRRIWRSFPGPGDLSWRAEAMAAFKQAAIDPFMLRRTFDGQRLDALPVEGGVHQ